MAAVYCRVGGSSPAARRVLKMKTVSIEAFLSSWVCCRYGSAGVLERGEEKRDGEVITSRVVCSEQPVLLHLLDSL
jgi:hypothetical protein